MAIKQGKIYSTERKRLETVLPLAVPFAVQIDVCSACNLKCMFCPHSDHTSVRNANIQWGCMSFDLYKKIIDDMATEWKEKVKKLRLFQMGEPLLNPNIVEMVRYAKNADVAENIEITTNATLLTHDLSIELVDAGLDYLVVSINGISEQQYSEVCGVNIDFKQLKDNLQFFYNNRKKCNVWLKYSDVGFTENEKENFYKLFEGCCDQFFVETISATLWQDTNISQKIRNAHVGTYGQELTPKKVCPFIFTTLIINDKGIAHLCCVDWKCQYVLGDLNKTSINSVWTGERLKEYQKRHLLMRKDEIDICVNCESLSANNIDNIDEYASDIYKLYD